MSSKLILYFAAASPPARACLLLARYLDLDVEVIDVNLIAGDQRKPEFLKLNPRNKVPVLVDGDFVLSESRAILAYLVNSRKPGSSLYPVDPKQRAAIDQFLHYDATVVFPSLSALVVRFGAFDEGFVSGTKFGLSLS
jgi:glutathione S-transferase